MNNNRPIATGSMPTGSIPIWTLLASLVAAALGTVPAVAQVDPDLSLSRTPGDPAVQLNWTGGAPTFEIYRSSDPSDVVSPGNRLAEVESYNFSDLPPAGGIVFYRIQSRSDCLRPIGDTAARQTQPNQNFGSAPSLFAGDDGKDRSFLKFSLDGIPTDAIVESATLILQQSSLVQGNPFEIYSASDPWLEDNLTWNDQPDIGPLYAVESQAAGSGARSWDVAGLVDDWLSGSTANHGLVVVANGNLAEYTSRETDESSVPRLCVQWRDPVEDALLDLNQQSPEGVRSRFGDATVETLDVQVPASSGDPVDAALQYLQDHRILFGIENPWFDLFLDRIREWEGMTAVAFGRRVQNIPVLDETLIVFVADGTVWGSSSRLRDDRTFEGEVLLTPEQARQFALNELSSQYPNLRTLGAPRPYWVPVNQDDPEPEVAFWVPVSGLSPNGGLPFNGAAFIHAETGALVRTVDMVHEAAENYQVRDAENESSDTCWAFPWENKPVWFDENGMLPAYPGAPADLFGDGLRVDNGIHEVYDHFVNNFGWRGMSGRGEGFRAYVHWNDVEFNNAMYTSFCNIMSFGDGWTSPDIVGHEFGHGLAFHTIPLFWEGQPAAIGEHIGDFFGSQLDGNWQLAEARSDADARTIRDMSDPPLFNDCEGMPHPDHMDLVRSIGCDKGGVHALNGVLNKAAYLLTDGDAHRGLVTSGIGRFKAGQLIFSVTISHTHPWSNLRMFGEEAVREAQRFLRDGLHGFTTNDVCDVINAYAAVGIGDPDTDCDGVPNAPADDGDGDGIRDGVDNCPNVSNRTQLDLNGDGEGDACDGDDDGDGVPDDADNCRRRINPGQEDTDGDGVGNVCDDDDRDRVLDLDDNCPTSYNPDQRDTDGDGMGDVCDNDPDDDGIFPADNCPLIFNPTQSNSDGDTLGNACDNCRFDTNEDQADMDRDGIGDVCDNDRDGDGVPNTSDNCPDVVNAAQFDNDGDGVGTACDSDELAFFSGLAGAQQLALFLQHNDIAEAMRLRIEPCSVVDCPGRLGPNFNTSVTLSNLTHDYAMRIVDDRGFAIADGLSFQGAPVTMTFSVDHEYFYQDGVSGLDYSGREYFLELIAPPGSQNGQVLEGLIEVESSLD